MEEEVIREKENANLEDILKTERAKSLEMTKMSKFIRRLKDKVVTDHSFKDNGIKYTGHGIENAAKIVVYSCITGGYDSICEPVFEFDNVEYVLFTDKNVEAKNWKVLPIPKYCNKNDNILTNRYMKMHPNEIFEKCDYDFAIYVDGNLKVIGDPRPLVYDTGRVGIAMHRHALREDIWKEMLACIAQRKGNPRKIMQQVVGYKKRGLPKKFGMLECNMIVVDLKNKLAKEILDEWWDEFLKSKSMRDQISLPYVIWKKGYSIEDFGNLGYNIYRNPKIRKVEHRI